MKYYQPHVARSANPGSEAELQVMLCDYLRLQYPSAIFRSDYAAGLKLTMQQAIHHKRLQRQRAWPDLQIAEARHGYHGLFLELKRAGSSPFKKDGSLRTDAHVQEQEAVLESLRKRGYKAEFAVGWPDARQKIDEYLSGSRAEQSPETF